MGRRPARRRVPSRAGRARAPPGRPDPRPLVGDRARPRVARPTSRARDLTPPGPHKPAPGNRPARAYPRKDPHVPHPCAGTARAVTARPRPAPGDPERPPLYALPDPDAPAPGAAPRGARPRAARGRAAHRRPAARDRRRGLRQDARDDRAHRAPDRAGDRPPRADPVDHLHQQGGRRDARAARPPRRPRARGRRHARHLPRAVRAHPARPPGRLGPLGALLDLRRGRLQARARALPDPRRQGADRARRGARRHLARQEPPRRARPVRCARHRTSSAGSSCTTTSSRSSRPSGARSTPSSNAPTPWTSTT